LRAELEEAFARLGFKFITLDLAGFRSGSLNSLVTLELSP
jgi:PP-loop superfamily ATP-utilizing enzyme